MNTTKRADNIVIWDVVIIDLGNGLGAYTVSEVEHNKPAGTVTIYLSRRDGAVPLTVPDYTQIRIID